MGTSHSVSQPRWSPPLPVAQGRVRPWLPSLSMRACPVQDEEADSGDPGVWDVPACCVFTPEGCVAEEGASFAEGADAVRMTQLADKDDARRPQQQP